MIMGLPLFLLFSVYGVVSAYLPILLFRLGYTPTLIGVLQGFFEASGLLFPIFLTSRVGRKGNYGQVLIFLTIFMLIVLPPLVMLKNFWITAVALSVFAIGFKGAVPVSDALINQILTHKDSNYGKIRVMGSIGFVCITLLLQFTHLLNADSPSSIALWIAIPSFLFILSIIFIPGLLSRYPPDESENEIQSPEISDTGNRVSIFKDFPLSFWAGIVLIFFGFLGLTPSLRFFSLYVQEYLLLKSYAGLWAISAAAEIPFMILSGWFIRKWGTEKILLLSLFAISLRNIVYAVFPVFGGAVAGQLFHSVCFGLFHPAAVVFVSERTSKRLLVVGLTLYSSVSVGLAAVLGSVLGGIIIDSLGYRGLFYIFSIFPLIGITIFVVSRKRFFFYHD